MVSMDSGVKLRAVIETLERIQNSRNGNPRWGVFYRWADGDATWATTAADAAFNYEVGNPGLRVGNVVWLTFDGRGRITNMEASK